MKRNGYFWFNQLDKGAQKRFIINSTFDFDWYMNEMFDNMYGFLSGAFIWHLSPEGFAYWKNIPAEGVITPRYKMKKFTM